MTLQSYDFELVYKPGRTHGNADAVSRIVNLSPVVASAEIGRSVDEGNERKSKE